MNIEEKIKIIKEYKEPAIAAINSYLDSMYNITDKFYDENNQRLSYLSEDKKLEDFLGSIKKETDKYEKIRKKLIEEDFNLSLLEINYVALSFLFVCESWNRQINNLQKATDEVLKIINSLMDKESKTIDFSEKE